MIDYLFILLGLFIFSMVSIIIAVYVLSRLDLISGIELPTPNFNHFSNKELIAVGQVLKKYININGDNFYDTETRTYERASIVQEPPILTASNVVIVIAAITIGTGGVLNYSQSEGTEYVSLIKDETTSRKFDRPIYS